MRSAWAAGLRRDEGGATLTLADTRTPGVYLVRRPKGEPIPFGVASDGREADLTRCTQGDRERVHRLIGRTDADADADAPTVERRELWWYLLVGLVGLLVSEVRLTRRLVMNANLATDAHG